MIIISNGDITKKVTCGAYKNFYKDMGFEVVKTSKPKVEIVEDAVIKSVETKVEDTQKEDKKIVEEKPKVNPEKRLQTKKK